MEKYRVLIVDDELVVRNSLQRIVHEWGYETLVAESGEEAMQKLRLGNPDIVLLDYRLGDLDGIEVLKRIKEEDEGVQVILLSAYGTFKIVVEAMKLGSFDYIQKPFQNEEIAFTLLKARETLKLKREVRKLRSRSLKEYSCERFVAESPEMKRVVDLAMTVGKSGDTQALIEGETGVGKELIALLIHNHSSRAEGPLITVNCGAFPKGLMESELFGYEKGAFTGALSSGKAGFLELAEGGTLFLDEVAELTADEQVKLLRILEGKNYFRVGGVKDRKVNARIISATNRNLKEEVRQERFREDLYYRLNVVSIKVPPLRERKSDIIPLAKLFIDEFNKKFNKKISGITTQARWALLNYEWKGNVRELKNIIERAVMLTKGDIIDSEFLRPNMANKTSNDSIVIDLSTQGIDLENVNKLLIKKAMDLTNNNILQAAKLLGLQRGALRYRLKKYEIAGSEEEAEKEAMNYHEIEEI